MPGTAGRYITGIKVVVWAETEEALEEMSRRTLWMLNSLLPQESAYQYALVQ